MHQAVCSLRERVEPGYVYVTFKHYVGICESDESEMAVGKERRRDEEGERWWGGTRRQGHFGDEVMDFVK
jgi:hypothetical protein